MMAVLCFILSYWRTSIQLLYHFDINNVKFWLLQHIMISESSWNLISTCPNCTVPALKWKHYLFLADILVGSSSTELISSHRERTYRFLPMSSLPTLSILNSGPILNSSTYLCYVDSIQLFCCRSRTSYRFRNVSSHVVINCLRYSICTIAGVILPHSNINPAEHARAESTSAAILSVSNTAIQSISKMFVYSSIEVQNCHHLLRFLKHKNQAVVLQWLPGGCQIYGYKQVNALAKNNDTTLPCNDLCPVNKLIRLYLNKNRIKK